MRSQPGNEFQMYQRFKHFKIIRPGQINFYIYIHSHICMYITFFKYNGNMPCTPLCLLLVFTSYIVYIYICVYIVIYTYTHVPTYKHAHAYTYIHT